METQTGIKAKKLRPNNGLEYVNKEFDGFCEEHGIQRQNS